MQRHQSGVEGASADVPPLPLSLCSSAVLAAAGVGFTAVDALLGPRRQRVKEVHSGPSQQPPPPRPSPPSSSPFPSSSPSSPSPSDCSQAVAALAECEGRQGIGSERCRFFRAKAEECRALREQLARGLH